MTRVNRRKNLYATLYSPIAYSLSISKAADIFLFIYCLPCAEFALAFFDSNEKAKDIFTAQQQQHTKWVARRLFTCIFIGRFVRACVCVYAAV